MTKGILLSVALLLAGCVTSPTLTTRVDPYNKQQHYRFGPIVAPDCDSGSVFNSGVTVSFVGNDDADLIQVTWAGQSWVFLQPGYGLKLLVDDAVVELPGVGTAKRDVLSGGVVFEEATYLISTDLVKQMRSASLVRLKAIGTNAYIEGCLAPKQLVQLDQVIPLL